MLSFSALIIPFLLVLLQTGFSANVPGNVSRAVSRWQNLRRSTTNRARIEGNPSLLLRTQMGGQPATARPFSSFKGIQDSPFIPLSSSFLGQPPKLPLNGSHLKGNPPKSQFQLGMTNLQQKPSSGEGNVLQHPEVQKLIHPISESYIGQEGQNSLPSKVHFLQKPRKISGIRRNSMPSRIAGRKLLLPGIGQLRRNSLPSPGAHSYSTRAYGHLNVEFDMVGIKMRTDWAIYDELDSDIRDLRQLFSNVDKTLPVAEDKTQLPEDIPPERRAESNQFFDNLPKPKHINPLVSRQKWKNRHVSESQVKRFKEEAMEVLMKNRKAIGERAKEILGKQMEELQKLLKEGRKTKVDEYWLRPDLEMAKELDGCFLWVLSKEANPPNGGMPQCQTDLNNLRTKIDEKWGELEKRQEKVEKSVLRGWKQRWDKPIIERMMELEHLVVRTDIAKLAMQIMRVTSALEKTNAEDTTKLGQKLLELYEETDDAIKSHNVGIFTSTWGFQICTYYYERKMDALGFLEDIKMNIWTEYWEKFDEEWARKLQLGGEEGIKAYAEFTGRNNPRGLLAFSEQRTLKLMAQLWELIHKAEQEEKKENKGDNDDKLNGGGGEGGGGGGVNDGNQPEGI